MSDEPVNEEIKPFGGGLPDEPDGDVGPTGRFARGSRAAGEEGEGSVAVATDPSATDPRWTAELAPIIQETGEFVAMLTTSVKNLRKPQEE